MANIKLEFEGYQGNKLAGSLDLPIGWPRAYAIFAHGFTLGKDFSAAARISRALAERGIAVLRFDFSGLGKSEGDFAQSNFSSNVEDLVHAADYLRTHHMAPALMVGHSLGGAAVLAAAGRVPECKAVATIGAPSDPEHVEHQFAGALDEIRAHGEATVKLGGRPFRITRQFLEDLEAAQVSECVARLNRALLVMHSPVDTFVSVDNARVIYQAAKHPKSYVSLDRADHLLMKRDDAEYAAHVLAAWAVHYLPPIMSDPLQPGLVEVAAVGKAKFDTVVRSGKHVLLADEPEALDGTDSGPNPYDYLLASLGACTSMTLRMYASRKKIPLENAIVRLTQRQVHSKDCEGCEDNGQGITELQREIRLVGKLTAEQSQKLLEIADKCPVHRTLTGNIKVVTQLAE